MNLDKKKIAVIGLGYVGLPLAVEFAKIRPVTGYDIRKDRVDELRGGFDSTLETDAEELKSARHLHFTSSASDLKDCGIFIITVPTPIDEAKRPDLDLLEKASRTVGQVMRPGTIVIYESTVYPGCTRQVCVPLLEQTSGLVFNRDFFVGYSPERINPGDKAHRLAMIRKVTSGSTPEVAVLVDDLYASIIKAGTHKAPSIEVAEAAKVIENTQRDLNIALMNELSIIFNKLGLDTGEILEAASTKWNFLPFKPGLVGGHCIGVDPYYLTYCAQKTGYHPEVILAGRRINDGMGAYVTERVVRLMLKKKIPVADSRILVMGLAFKENCPDLRNSKVIDVVNELKDRNAIVDVYDPWVDAKQARREFDVELIEGEPVAGVYEAVVIAVGHCEFAGLGAKRIRALGKPGAVVFDVKGVLDKSESDGRL